MKISNGRFLLSVEDAVQKIRDAFFTGKCYRKRIKTILVSLVTAVFSELSF